MNLVRSKSFRERSAEAEAELFAPVAGWVKLLFIMCVHRPPPPPRTRTLTRAPNRNSVPHRHSARGFNRTLHRYLNRASRLVRLRAVAKARLHERGNPGTSGRLQQYCYSNPVATNNLS